MSGSIEILIALFGTIAGMLAAFALGAWSARGSRREANPAQTSGTPPELAQLFQQFQTPETPQVNGTPEPNGVGSRSVRMTQLIRGLRLPANLDDFGTLAAWYQNLRDASPLAASLHPTINQALTDALDAVRDLINIPNLDDRYELFAAALLPVYEACASYAVEGGRTTAAEKPSRVTTREIEPVTPAYTETDRSTQPVDRTELLRRVQQAAQDTLQVETFPVSPAEPGTATARLMQENARAMNSSQLSRRLTEILREPGNASATISSAQPENRPLPLQLIRETPESKGMKSRLKRPKPESPEEEAIRRAAQVVGRAREWYGRPDITFEQVQIACREFGMEFDGPFISEELKKPLPDEAFV